MNFTNQRAKNLLSKDFNIAKKSALEIIENKDFEAFSNLVENEDNIFDFIKDKINKAFLSGINSNNFKNLFCFMKLYSPSFCEFIINGLLKFANEELTDEIYELFENGKDDEKIYCALYFSNINDTIALDVLRKNALSENTDLMSACAYALGVFQDKVSFNKALEDLKSEDEKKALLAVSFLESYGDKSALLPLLDYLRQTYYLYQVASSILRLNNFREIIDKLGISATLEIYDKIINAYPEELSLSTILDFELVDFVHHLLNNNFENSYKTRLLLTIKTKFELFAKENIYTFDLDKIIKDSIFEINNLLKSFSYENSFQEELFCGVNERVLEALELIAELNLKKYSKYIIELIQNTKNEIILCQIASTIKALGGLEDNLKHEILNKISNKNIRAIVETY